MCIRDSVPHRAAGPDDPGRRPRRQAEGVAPVPEVRAHPGPGRRDLPRGGGRARARGAGRRTGRGDGPVPPGQLGPRRGLVGSRPGPVTTVAERLEPAEVYEAFLAFRERLGMEILTLGGGDVFRTLTRRLRDGGFVPLLAEERDLDTAG